MGRSGQNYSLSLINFSFSFFFHFNVHNITGLRAWLLGNKPPLQDQAVQTFKGLKTTRVMLHRPLLRSRKNSITTEEEVKSRLNMTPQYPRGVTRPPLHNRQVAKINKNNNIHYHTILPKPQLRMFRELACILHAVHTSQTISQNTAMPAKTVQPIIVSHTKIHF